MAKTFLDVVTCKIKHLQNICKDVLEPSEVDSSKTFLQMFYFTCNHGLTDMICTFSVVMLLFDCQQEHIIIILYYINYRMEIEKFYAGIVHALTEEASKVNVPNILIPYRALKDFWSDDLDYLKQQSIDIHNLWKGIGQPHHV